MSARRFPRQDGRFVVRKFGVVLGLLIVLAGCGGDDAAQDTAELTVPEDAPTADPDAATSDTTDPPAEVTTTDEVAVAADPCSLVTADDVELATGLVVVAVDDAALDPTGCVFELGLSADVFVETGGLAGFMFTNYQDLVDGGTAELIPDIGVAAVYAPGFRGLAVDVGQGEFFAVGLNGGYPEELAETREVLVALASAAAARL
jgi:hypothetical protein